MSDRRALLLLIDNFEHLLDAAPMVATMPTSTPNTKVLVTSRAPLRISGERDQGLARARGTLPEDVFAAEWSRGEQMDLDAAVSVAVQSLD